MSVVALAVIITGALIVNANGIFEIESYRSVAEYTRYWVLGSGNKLALGALHALYDKEDNLLTLAEAAIKAACEFDDGCALPMTHELVELSEASPGA